eukprot:3709197-Rhodomonas_salina.3
MVEAHRDWPHGFSYLQLRAGKLPRCQVPALSALSDYDHRWDIISSVTVCEGPAMVGQDGELLANLFLKDYSQYAPNSYYMDTVTIPKDVFTRSLSQDGKFEFTIMTPPGFSALCLPKLAVCCDPSPRS